MNESPKQIPDEVRRRFSDWVRESMNARPAEASPSGEEDGGVDVAAASKDPIADFRFLPRDIKAHLDRFVIRQDEAKKTLATAVCDHFNHLRQLRDKSSEAVRAGAEHAKQNILLLGATGVGKTYLVRHVADLVGVPFVKADATKFSETGYVGGDVDDLVRELVRKADGDVALAEYGIIYLDEIDKLAATPGTLGRDVSGRGVQTSLLKLMEETEIAVRSPMDIQGQLQAAMEMGRSGKPKRDVINTRNILFVVSGAFPRLREVVEKRLNTRQIGFQGGAGTEETGAEEMLALCRTEDFVEYGLEAEFIARLPVRVALEDLSESDLLEIMKRSEGSLLLQYERAFRAYGIQIEFADEALEAIARLAFEEKTGARGLMTVCERVLRDFKYELPGTGIDRLRVDRTLVEQPALVLRLLREQARELQAHRAMETVGLFLAAFREKHGWTLRFTPEASAAIIHKAEAQGTPILEFCEVLLQDYPYGLKLLRPKGISELELPEKAIENPDGFLSELVVQSYGST